MATHPSGGQILNLTAAAPSRNLTDRYRRNGKLQSCEPCRKSKLRCDHVLPACGRCVRKRATDKCVYHPSPLTQQAKDKILQSPVTTRSTATSFLPDSAIGDTSAFAGPRNPSPVTTPSLAVSESRCSSVPPAQADESLSSPPTHNFMGVTSFSSILSESLGKSGVAADMATARTPNTAITQERIDQGCQVLALLQNRAVVDGFISLLYEVTEGSADICSWGILRGWLTELWAKHGDILANQSPKQIRELSELIWSNTGKPVPYDRDTTPEQWILATSGDNLRWEVIGLIILSVADIAACANPSDRIFTEHRVDRGVIVHRTIEAAKKCLSFCEDCEVIDDLLLWLARGTYSVTCVTASPNKFSSYQASGVAISAITAMGLHDNIDPDGRAPFFLLEIRKQLFAIVYCQEIGISTFLGRPPRLSYRYCHISPPLGLTEAQILLDKDELSPLIAELDADGYPPGGKMNTIVFRKIWLNFAPRREDILDLSLGQYTPEEVLRRGLEIEARMEQIWASMPESIRACRDGPVGYDQMTPMERSLLDTLRQGSRANQILLQRVLIRKAGVGSENLIRVAQLSLQDILQVSQRPEMNSMLRSEMVSQLVTQGLRCAAILAVELLRREQLRVYPSDPPLPRSQTIRDLSVIVSRLSAVGPDEGWYHSCDQGAKLLGRILDKILDPPAAAVAAVVKQNTATTAAGTGTVTTTTTTGAAAAGINGDSHATSGHHLRGGVPTLVEPVSAASASAAAASSKGQFDTAAAHQFSNHIDPAGWDLDFSLDVPFLGNDSDLMNWFEGAY